MSWRFDHRKNSRIDSYLQSTFCKEGTQYWSYNNPYNILNACCDHISETLLTVASLIGFSNKSGNLPLSALIYKDGCFFRSSSGNSHRHHSEMSLLSLLHDIFHIFRSGKFSFSQSRHRIRRRSHNNNPRSLLNISRTFSTLAIPPSISSILLL